MIKKTATDQAITIFMCGDVMTGRGIDQILPYPGNPALYESFMKSALGYVGLAEEATGPIPKPVDFGYIWGDALDELSLRAPDARIINLETAVTTSDDCWPEKEVTYRMNPKNAPCLTAAHIDYCSLANNHVLDWGYAGLSQTLATLHDAGIATAGAGENSTDAERPAVIDVGVKGRVIVFSAGSETGGVPSAWAAAPERPGVNLLNDLSPKSAKNIARIIRPIRKPLDIVVFSVHWGWNWGYEILREQRIFARTLIDEAGADIIHGHSSHHVKGIEIYKDRPIIYGCGDFLNDYEGIRGNESYRGDLGLMYFVTVDPATGKLRKLSMTPTQVRHFRVNRASRVDALWLKEVLNREGSRLATTVNINPDNILTMKWNW